MPRGSHAVLHFKNVVSDNIDVNGIANRFFEKKQAQLSYSMQSVMTETGINYK